MITTRLMGGLGNQLFQWACARNLQKLYGHRLQYDDHIRASSRNRDIFRFPNIRLSNDAYIKESLYPETPMQFVNVGDFFDFNKFKENDFRLGRDFHLIGYWQGLKYFEDVQEELRLELQPPDDFFDNKVKPTENSVSLHVRRTDYMHIQDHHPVCSIDYYKHALSLIDHDHIFIFSDDIKWCQNNLDDKNVTFVHNEDPLHDMWLMSNCTHNIIANSTFSWWSAWLNSNPNKVVIAPKNWFGPAAPSDRDVVPEKWIRL